MNNLNILKKILVTFFIMIICVGVTFNVSYGLVVSFSYSTIKFENVSPECNLYVLIEKNNKKNSSYERLDLDIEKGGKEEFESILKDYIFIEEQHQNELFSDGLENTHEEIFFQGKIYDKIKITKDASITYTCKEKQNEGETHSDLYSSTNVLFAKINNNNVNIIKDLDNLKLEYYHIDREGYGGDSIGRYFAVYDASTETLTDVTKREIKEEEKFVLRKVKQNKEYRTFIAVLRFIIKCTILGATLGLVIYFVQKKKKRK